MRLFWFALTVAVINVFFWYAARNLNVYIFVAVATFGDFAARGLAPAIIKEVRARREIRSLNSKWRS